MTHSDSHRVAANCRRERSRGRNAATGGVSVQSDNAALAAPHFRSSASHDRRACRLAVQLARITAHRSVAPCAIFMERGAREHRKSLESGDLNIRECTPVDMPYFLQFVVFNNFFLMDILVICLFSGF